MTPDQESWILDVALNVDIFGRGYCGYWAFGLYVAVNTWLVYDEGDDSRPSKAECYRATTAYVSGASLPPRWHLLDRSAAERALAAGERRYGENFPTNYDGSTADVAVQLALLGEVRYG